MPREMSETWMRYPQAPTLQPEQIRRSLARQYAGEGVKVLDQGDDLLDEFLQPGRVSPRLIRCREHSMQAMNRALSR